MMTTSRIRGGRSETSTGPRTRPGRPVGRRTAPPRLGAPLPGAARWCPGGPARTPVVTAARGAATKQPDMTRTAGTSQHRAVTVSGAQSADTSPSECRPPGRALPRRRGRHGLRHGPGGRALRHRPRRRGRPHRHAGTRRPGPGRFGRVPRVRADIPRPASKAAKQRNQPKSRGKASRKHDDDENDWPSTEWDKLSDVEYWAELSADKPLATTARTAQPSAAAKPAADTARAASGRPAAPPAPVDYPDGTMSGGQAGPASPVTARAIAEHQAASRPRTRPAAPSWPASQRPADRPAGGRPGRAARRPP